MESRGIMEDGKVVKEGMGKWNKMVVDGKISKYG